MLSQKDPSKPTEEISRRSKTNCSRLEEPFEANNFGKIQILKIFGLRENIVLYHMNFPEWKNLQEGGPIKRYQMCFEYVEAMVQRIIVMTSSHPYS